MRIPKAAFDIIVRNEDFRAEPYQDVGGVWTIGYGHTRSNILPTKVSEEEARDLLLEDIEYFEDKVLDLVEVPLNENQLGALVSFTFNVGESRLKSSTLLKKLNKGDYNGAANEFQKWRKAGGQIMRGLIKRRAYEEQLFRTAPDKGVNVVPIQADQFLMQLEGMEPEELQNFLADTALIVLQRTANVYVPGEEQVEPVRDDTDTSVDT